MLTDIRLALTDLRRVIDGLGDPITSRPLVVGDRVQRAIDRLERIEASLANATLAADFPKLIEQFNRR